MTAHPEFIVEPLESEEDLDEVIAVSNASFTNPWSREVFLWELRSSEVSHLHVLHTPEQRVAGFCSSWLVLDELHINNIAVRPECRGRGLGRALLVAVLRWAGRSGASRVTLEVRRSNSAALKLYDRLGFAVAAVRRNYYTNPVEDGLILWRSRLQEFAEPP